MFLRNSKTFKSKADKSSTYGTIDKNNPKAFFFEYKLNVICLIDDTNLNKITNKIQKLINKLISQEISQKFPSLFFKEHVITILEIKASNLKQFKQSKIDFEITVKPINNLLKIPNIESLLSQVNKNFKEIIKNNLIYFKTI